MRQKKLKVLIIQPFLSYGGAEAVSVQFAYHLASKAHDAKIIALWHEEERLPYPGHKVDIITSPRILRQLFKQSRLFFFLFGFPTLLFLALKESKGASVFNPHNFPSLWVAGIVGRLCSVPVVWTVHNLPQTPFRNGLVSTICNPTIDLLNGLFARRCKEVIVVSDKVKNQVKRRWGVDSKVFYPAIDYDFWSKGSGKEIRKKYGWEDEFVILSVGRLTKEKNQELSIRAFAKVIKRVGKAILVLVGDGEDKDRLETVAKGEGVFDKTLFVGYQTPDTLRDFYAASDLHLLPGHETEGFNLAPLEALCAQTISIVAEGSGVDVVLKENDIGLVAKPKVEDFAKEIITAFRNKDKIIKMGKKGKDWVRKNLSWENYIDEFLRLELFKGV